MQFPVTLSFKKIALAQQVTAIDASGQQLFYSRQKMLKLKEEINVFTDKSQTTKLYQINADRVIDFSARYHFKDNNSIAFGSIKREGARSIWNAHYEIADENEQPLMHIKEDNPWVKVLDAVCSEIPIVNLFTGYFFNPTYTITNEQGEAVMRITKKPAFLESSFVIDDLVDLSDANDMRVVLGILMMVFLERGRG